MELVLFVCAWVKLGRVKAEGGFLCHFKFEQYVIILFDLKIIKKNKVINFCLFWNNIK